MGLPLCLYGVPGEDDMHEGEYDMNEAIAQTAHGSVRIGMGVGTQRL